MQCCIGHYVALCLFNRKDFRETEMKSGFIVSSEETVQRSMCPRIQQTLNLAFVLIFEGGLIHFYFI